MGNVFGRVPAKGTTRQKKNAKEKEKRRKKKKEQRAKHSDRRRQNLEVGMDSRTPPAESKTKTKKLKTLRSLKRDVTSKKKKVSTESIRSLLTPCTRSFIEPKTPVKPNPKRERRVEDDAEDTKAEKPKKREKSLVTPKKEESSTVNVEPTAITPLQLELLTAKEDESVYATSVPRETTEHDVTSCTVPIVETACEDKAFITELLNKPAPNTDHFSRMADPFATENEVLDVSDTIFDVANEFPDLYLRGSFTAPKDSEFIKNQVRGKTKVTRLRTRRPHRKKKSKKNKANKR